MKILITLLLAICLIKVDFMVVPEWEPWSMKRVEYNPKKNVFVDYNEAWDNWMMYLSLERRKNLMKPMEIPAKKKVSLSIRQDLFKDEKHQLIASVLPATMANKNQRRRFILINVEETILDKTKISDRQYRVWPHLGLLFVGTAAHEENWEVILWDELVQGHADLEKLILPGDIVGFSLVVTGIERGVHLAHQAKVLGARYCIAGNDSAIFRVNQLLALPGKPIDVVFTTNSVIAVRSFFRQVNDVPLQSIVIPGVEMKPGIRQRSNEHDFLVQEMQERKDGKRTGKFDPYDVFIIPKLDLFPALYWEEVWSNYRMEYGHKHVNPTTVKSATALFAQGCTRTQGVDVCSYCTIAGVADIRIPNKDYLAKTFESYQNFGIDNVYNVTDSAFEMTQVVDSLQALDSKFNAMILYGRAQGIAKMPNQIDKWLSLVNDRLLLNTGMDSGDESILKSGVVKSSIETGSRLQENRNAILNIKKSGAHLLYSLIFGSPGETKDSCDRSMEFLEWSVQTLGSQLDICETDIYWLNFGSPVSALFTNYPYAVGLAAQAGKFITPEEWKKNFAEYKDCLVMPMEVERSWYRFFTNIDLDTAQDYNRRSIEIMAKHTGSIRGRAFKPSLNS